MNEWGECGSTTVWYETGTERRRNHLENENQERDRWRRDKRRRKKEWGKGEMGRDTGTSIDQVVLLREERREERRESVIYSAKYTSLPFNPRGGNKEGVPHGRRRSWTEEWIGGWGEGGGGGGGIRVE